MSDISLDLIAGKMNRVGYDSLMKALRQAKNAGNRNVELAHLLHHMLSVERSDFSMILDHLNVDRTTVERDLARAIDGFKKNVTDMPGFSRHIWETMERGWYYATLLFGEVQIRTGHILAALLNTEDLRQAMAQLSKPLGQIDPEAIMTTARPLFHLSDEDTLRPMDGSGIDASSAPAGEGGERRGSTALDRFTTDMTADAAAGKTDPIVGRDEEIRQIVDVLMRRRQNNPILVGEAGVGKTAVVEGFAQKLAAGDVPPQLKGVKLRALDVGLLQAGASMKGEFEQRLRSVIDEVQASPTPLILFIDEAHTLVGAGGQAGTGDAANLLKPALARGTLRTIGATTWSEYRKYFEKDPALTRRFQPVDVPEPSLDKCAYMLRGILEPMEKHHKVKISDKAVVAAVQLSARYIPSRQLPDKAVSLLDTACARVAISQAGVPPVIEDLKASLDSMRRELVAQQREAEIGGVNQARIDELTALMADTEAKLATHDEEYKRERTIVDEILELRKKLIAGAKKQDEAAAALAAGVPADAPTTSEPSAPEEAAEPENIPELLGARATALEEIDPDKRMIFAHVDEQAVASVVSDWTGIPVGRMVKDEIETILQLADILKKRVIGQDHGLNMISKRIETNRAKLDNPNKPIGVFMLCGPSGVGKTETALALAESLYGGEQNVITINMSEFQEAHTVSLLKGAPPGYVGYGEGGRLTEAVRRRPYSVVLLDEVEKAHSDVHELFFQVFDKGQMEDGTGRMIDFKNTLIILTSNVGTEVIMRMADEGKTRPSPDELSVALRPSLTQVFPPALLGRIVTIPYFPLSGDMIAGIVKLQLDRITRRVRDNHKASFTYTPAVVDYIVSQCNDPDSGGRMIDNIITNTMLPELSRNFLKFVIDKADITSAAVDHADGKFVYTVN